MRWLLLVAAIQQFLVPIFVNPFQGGRESWRAPTLPSGIEPAGYAFSIWALIYLSAIAFAVWQFTEDGRSDPATERAQLPAILLYLGSSIWLVFAKYGPYWGTMPVLVLMAACAVVILWIASNVSDPTRARWWFMVVPFALYAGWTSCAAFVNVAEVAPAYGWDRFGLSRDLYANLSLGAAAIVAIGVLAGTRGNLIYAATIVWALVAIAVAAWTRELPNSIIIASLVGAILVASASWWISAKSPFSNMSSSE